MLAGVHPAPQEAPQPAHPQPLAAAQHGAALVRAARRLHDGEVRHEHVRARHGRGVARATASRSTRCGRAPSIATAAVQNLLGGDDGDEQGSRKPEIMADAAHAILTKPAREFTGNFLIDDEVLAAAGVTDLERYRAGRGDDELIGDLFVDDAPLRRLDGAAPLGAERARHGRGDRARVGVLVDLDPLHPLDPLEAAAARARRAGTARRGRARAARRRRGWRAAARARRRGRSSSGSPCARSRARGARRRHGPASSSSRPRRTPRQRWVLEKPPVQSSVAVSSSPRVELARRSASSCAPHAARPAGRRPGRARARVVGDPRGRWGSRCR